MSANHAMSQRSKRSDATQSRSQTAVLLIVTIARIFATSRLATRLYEPGREEYLNKGEDPILAFFVRSFYLFSENIFPHSPCTGFFLDFNLFSFTPSKTTLVTRLCHKLCNDNHRSCRGTDNGGQRAVWWRSSFLRSTCTEKTFG